MDYNNNIYLQCRSHSRSHNIDPAYIHYLNRLFIYQPHRKRYYRLLHTSRRRNIVSLRKPDPANSTHRGAVGQSSRAQKIAVLHVETVRSPRFHFLFLISNSAEVIYGADCANENILVWFGHSRQVFSLST